MTSIVHDVSYSIAGSFETGKTGSKQKINQQFTELLILYYNVKDDAATAQSNLGAGRSLSFLKPPRLLSCI